MKESCSRGTPRIFLTRFLLIGCGVLALLFSSGQPASAQDPTPTPLPTPRIFPIGAAVQIYSGTAIINTANCSGTGGLCQPSPACNGGAGPNPDNITARVDLCEVAVSVETSDGVHRNIGTLTVRGTGSGFRPGVTYVSLLYKNGNTATCSRFPAGVAPTLQNMAQADSDFASMHLGFWVIDASGNGTLTVDKEATIPGLDQYATVSVREMQPPNTGCYDSGKDPAPQLNALRACGALTVTPATSCALP
jgi:hypothetical protein